MFTDFGEKGREGDRERERETSTGCLQYVPDQEPNLEPNSQPRLVHWPAIEPRILWFTAQCSNHLSHASQGTMHIF